ncbi:MAG: peptidoglycan-binding domain-containing protein [Candidatus Thiodiazotropha lotti]
MPSVSNAKDYMLKLIETESAGRISLNDFTKINALEKKVLGNIYHVVVYEAIIEFTQDSRWIAASMGEIRDFKAKATDARQGQSGWAGYNAGLMNPGRNVTKGSIFKVSGEIFYEKTESGWRPAGQSISSKVKLTEGNAGAQKIQSAPQLKYSQKNNSTARADRRVQTIQERLQLLGYMPVETTGYVDNHTKSAINSFESKVGIANDGRVSKSLFDALFESEKKRLQASISLKIPNYFSGKPLRRYYQVHPNSTNDYLKGIERSDNNKVFAFGYEGNSVGGYFISFDSYIDALSKYTQSMPRLNLKNIEYTTNLEPHFIMKSSSKANTVYLVIDKYVFNITSNKIQNAVDFAREIIESNNLRPPQ